MSIPFRQPARRSTCCSNSSLGERLKPQPHWDFAFFDRVRAALLANLDERTHDDRFPLVPQRLVAEAGIGHAKEYIRFWKRLAAEP